MSLFARAEDFDERDAIEERDDDGIYRCECGEASAGDRCDVCHAGVCEGCSGPVLHENIGDRVPDDPTLMWCKTCASKMHEAEAKAERDYVMDIVTESRR